MKHSIQEVAYFPCSLRWADTMEEGNQYAWSCIQSMLWLKQTRNLLEKHADQCSCPILEMTFPSNTGTCLLVLLQSENGKGLSDLEAVPGQHSSTHRKTYKSSVLRWLESSYSHFPSIKISAVSVTYYLIFYIPKIISRMKIIMLVLWKAVISKERLQLC